ncbi:MAG: hypothetical protein ABIH00_01475 [Armatimonadota bacterium]
MSYSNKEIMNLFYGEIIYGGTKHKVDKNQNNRFIADNSRIYTAVKMQDNIYKIYARIENRLYCVKVNDADDSIKKKISEAKKKAFKKTVVSQVKPKPVKKAVKKQIHDGWAANLFESDIIRGNSKNYTRKGAKFHTAYGRAYKVSKRGSGYRVYMYICANQAIGDRECKNGEVFYYDITDPMGDVKTILAGRKTQESSNTQSAGSSAPSQAAPSQTETITNRTSPAPEIPDATKGVANVEQQTVKQGGITVNGNFNDLIIYPETNEAVAKETVTEVDPETGETFTEVREVPAELGPGGFYYKKDDYQAGATREETPLAVRHLGGGEYTDDLRFTGTQVRMFREESPNVINELKAGFEMSKTPEEKIFYEYKVLQKAYARGIYKIYMSENTVLELYSENGALIADKNDAYDGTTKESTKYTPENTGDKFYITKEFKDYVIYKEIKEKIYYSVKDGSIGKESLKS